MVLALPSGRWDCGPVWTRVQEGEGGCPFWGLSVFPLPGVIHSPHSQASRDGQSIRTHTQDVISNGQILENS